MNIKLHTVIRDITGKTGMERKRNRMLPARLLEMQPMLFKEMITGLEITSEE